MKDDYLVDTIETARCTVRVYRPNIDDQERSRRMAQIARAAASLIKEQERGKAECTERTILSQTSTGGTRSKRGSLHDTRLAPNAAR